MLILAQLILSLSLTLALTLLCWRRREMLILAQLTLAPTLLTLLYWRRRQMLTLVQLALDLS